MIEKPWEESLAPASDADRIRDLDELRALYGQPSELVIKKSLPRLDPHCRAFIARSPFLCLATSAPEGPADVSPRGDAPGFARVLDDHSILIPDRVGNNRIDSLANIVRNPRVALLFLVPGVDETLRVNGQASLSRRADWLNAAAVQGKLPRSIIHVVVEEAFLQCGKAPKRARLWSDDYRIARNELPSLGRMLVDQTDCSTTVAELDEAIEKSYRERMY